MQKYGMSISRDKTDVMVSSREPIQCDIELDAENLKQVEKFKYLSPLGDTNRTFVVYKQKPTDFQCESQTSPLSVKGVTLV